MPSAAWQRHRHDRHRALKKARYLSLKVTPKAKMLDNPKKVALAQSLYENRDNTIDDICKTLNVSRATLYRYIKTKATQKNTPNL